ncbi:hypothetical protein [Bacillus sp. PS06]|nr:hypothetical protein [Bacillus sp. PS06]MBD8071314.1 hypothetical protein [Bacillus sp. PS06]
MVIIERLDEAKLKEILLNAYSKGVEKENIHVKDLIDEIILQITEETNV